ncbi:hypothetical protein HDU67_008195 [Dinochytrium kinnereticum]|nr:hypothetical protein HDU67_008195 [Dinochytrium kinnereticum]
MTTFYDVRDGDDKYISTSTDSYKRHDPNTTTEDFKSERDQYLKNKLKANHGGDWWSQREEVVPQRRVESHNPNGESNYAVSFGSHSQVQHDDNWLAHRRKKAISQDDGKVYNILTGMESSQMSGGGRYDPNRSAKRVSAEKLEVAKNEAIGRVYNIISNV